MRTTLDLDDAVLAAARSLARDEGVSLGAVVSRLARRGLGAGSSSVDAPRFRRSFPTFPASPDSPPITPELVKEAEARDDLDHVLPA